MGAGRAGEETDDQNDTADAQIHGETSPIPGAKLAGSFAAPRGLARSLAFATKTHAAVGAHGRVGREAARTAAAFAKHGAVATDAPRLAADCDRPCPGHA